MPSPCGVWASRAEPTPAGVSSWSRRSVCPAGATSHCGHVSWSCPGTPCTATSMRRHWRSPKGGSALLAANRTSVRSRCRPASRAASFSTATSSTANRATQARSATSSSSPVGAAVPAGLRGASKPRRPGRRSTPSPAARCRSRRIRSCSARVTSWGAPRRRCAMRSTCRLSWSVEAWHSASGRRSSTLRRCRSTSTRASRTVGAPGSPRRGWVSRAPSSERARLDGEDSGVRHGVVRRVLAGQPPNAR